MKVDFLLPLRREVCRVASKLMKEMQIAIHRKAEEHQGIACRILNHKNAIKNAEGDLEALFKVIIFYFSFALGKERA